MTPRRGLVLLTPTIAPRARPVPPTATLDVDEPTVVPDAAAADWIRATFLAAGAPLENPDHLHLRDAVIGVVWTSVPYVRQGRTVVGTAEIPEAQGNAWKRARHDAQLRWWFSRVPTFLLTLSAPELSTVSDRQFCAVIEHELYHCAQAADEFGQPKFHLDGSPWWAIRGHSVEEFTGVVARYGATSPDVLRFVAAANATPQVDDATIALGCGVCAGRAA